MRAATLKLKSYAASVNANVNIMNNNIEVQKVILRSILISFGALAIFYVLILGSMVFNIVERKSMEKEALTLTNDVGNLELSYLSLSKSVDLSLSSQMGYIAAKPSFATRKSLGSIKVTSNEI